MHGLKPHSAFRCLLLLFIGIFACVLNAAEGEPDFEQLEKDHMIYVEPTHMITSEKDGDYELEGYIERRPKWGSTVAIEYNSYQPLRYKPSFPEATYSQVYGSPDQALVELVVTAKRNLSIGSVGVEIGGGILKNGNTKKDDNGVAVLGDSTLSLTLFRLGAVYNMDMLWNTPYVVPYVSAGAYMILYKEALASASFNGNTQPAPYTTVGLAFQLDWLDPRSARQGYQTGGLENSFLFVEGRSLFASLNTHDPDFTSTIDWAAGLKLEF